MHGNLINPKSELSEAAHPDRPFDERASRRETTWATSDWQSAAAILYAVSPGIVFLAAVIIHTLVSG